MTVRAYVEREYQWGPMTASITSEKAAKVTHPKQEACGPDLTASVAPTIQPDKTGFHTSCLALCFSMMHSTPPKRAVKMPKLFAHPMVFPMVDLYAARSCSRSGATGTYGNAGVRVRCVGDLGARGTSLPLMTWMADWSEFIAPMNNPRTTPPTLPSSPLVIILLPHDSHAQEGSTGYPLGRGRRT